MYAVESQGAAYAVVGWDEYGFPFLLALNAPGAAPRNPIEHERFTFTTTDPSGPDREHVTDLRAALNQANRNLAEFRQCMAVIADTLDDDGNVSSRSISALIRQELNR